MRVILDTNIFISSLIRPDTPPGLLIDAWLDDRFDLISHVLQFEEMHAVTRRPQLRRLVRSSTAGRLINQIKQRCILIEKLSPIKRSLDPADDFLLALCEKSNADFLVTGDKSGLLILKKHGTTKIVTARSLVDLLKLG
jgi:uncharacterized protein